MDIKTFNKLIGGSCCELGSHNYLIVDHLDCWKEFLLKQEVVEDKAVAQIKKRKRPEGDDLSIEMLEELQRRKEIRAHDLQLIETKQERNKPCSGRDELCNSVLNDDWASHPTWASEDSGFVAHRKNQYEESLHRIEEERHDYDFNIETNGKVIQLLEPIAQSLLAMTQQEREAFRLPLGLGTPSRAIYNRVFKKIYGTEGPRVVQELFEDPCAVLPVVLPRLKQKDEEWRLSQVSSLQHSSVYLTNLPAA